MGHITPDLDIQPDFFKIIHKGRAIMPFQMKKADRMTGFLAAYYP